MSAGQAWRGARGPGRWVRIRPSFDSIPVCDDLSLTCTRALCVTIINVVELSGHNLTGS